MNFNAFSFMYSFRRTPVTISLVFLSVLCYIIDVASGGALYNIFSFQPLIWYESLYTMLTFPLVNDTAVLNMILGAFVLYFIGTSVEYEIGPMKMLSYLLTISLILSNCALISYYISGHHESMAGLTIITSCLFVVWVARNMDKNINFWGIIPMSAKVFGVLIVLLTVFTLRWPLSALVLIPLGISYLFATDRFSFWKYSGFGFFDRKRQKRKQEKEFKQYLDAVHKRQQEREEQEKLRKLFERSFGKDYDGMADDNSSSKE